ncbi:hypothetical protein K7887_18470 [Sutcliffiella horikoshii]|uniref:hypothetical protein n=1 Tax=Sutcliffiella horikoshii TaxID=79883 RepID=UPI001CBDCC1A|nr:hypothetical protein [Sutcliffiella horikoshii]UAL46826.1 hypothetical protein K7887_18470 [Sutcliffiella horikoshii]
MIINHENRLRQAVNLKRSFLINKLSGLNYIRTPDGCLVKDLTLTELEQVYENEKARMKHD